MAKAKANPTPTAAATANPLLQSAYNLQGAHAQQGRKLASKCYALVGGVAVPVTSMATKAALAQHGSALALSVHNGNAYLHAAGAGSAKACTVPVAVHTPRVRKSKG